MRSNRFAASNHHHFFRAVTEYTEKSDLASFPTILVVDDNVGNLKLVEQILRQDYKPVLLTSGRDALKYLDLKRPDLIVLDIDMPEMSGYDVIRKIKQRPEISNIPVIFFSAKSDDESELEGLSCGAVDFIGKPVIPALLIHRIRTQLELFKYRHHLELVVQEKTIQILQLQQTTVTTLTELSECRDSETGSHIKRTSLYVETLARELARVPKFAEELTEEKIYSIITAAPLHDIGKMAIPDAILNKPGRLTREEVELMKTHVEIGAATLRRAIDSLGFASFLDIGLELCLTHHEKWDGTGYPAHLSGEAIPLAGRIMALADVYDALTSTRPYKSPLSHEVAAAIIAEGKNHHFDPDLVDVFLRVSSRFSEIGERLNHVTSPTIDEII